MIRLENTQDYGWEAAIRGMRNPKNSWDKSDSYFGLMEDPSPINPDDMAHVILGENDHDLMMRLRNAGTDHRKFMRMLTVYVDIAAPLYWWKEFDTYKVGTVANSCSTMHKIHDKEFTLDDFSYEHLMRSSLGVADSVEVLDDVICTMNYYRAMFLETKNKDYWWQMIQLLPSSYNQKRTVQINYQVAKAQRTGRRHHKLDEWHDYCDWLEGLPYFKEICLGEVKE